MIRHKLNADNVIRQYHELRSCRAVAELYGCNQETIRRLLKDNNVSLKGWKPYSNSKTHANNTRPRFLRNEENELAIIEAYKRLGNQKLVSNEIGASIGTVNRVCVKYAVSKRHGGSPHKITDEELIAACKFMTLNEIADKYQMHPQSLPRRFSRLGVKPIGYAERTRAEKKPSKIYNKVCPVCGITFSTKIKTQKTCGVECGNVYRKQQHKERNKKWAEANKAKRIEYRNRHEVERACAICGGLFYCLDTESIKTCSSECSRKYKRTRHDKRVPKERRIDRITITDLYRRDGGRCYLCGGLCNWNDWRTADSGNKYPGDTYPTIDHVLPVSKGGADSWSNVRLAHWACNLKKADGVIQIDPLTKEFAYSQKKHSNAAKKTKQYTLDGELLRIWDSTMQIKRETGLNEKRIQEVCRKNKSGYAFGYHWEYAV